MLAVLAFSAAVVSAADTKADATKAEPTDMTLKGKLVKEGSDKKVSFVLETKDYGKVELSAKSVKVDDGVKLEDFAGQDVEVAVKAVETPAKKKVHVTEIVSVKKAEMAKADAPKTETPAAPAVPATPAK
jgi:hypothetical protein